MEGASGLGSDHRAEPFFDGGHRRIRTPPDKARQAPLVNDRYAGCDLPNAGLGLARLSQPYFVGSGELGAGRIVDNGSIDLAAIAFEAGIASLKVRKHLFANDFNLSMFAAVENL